MSLTTLSLIDRLASRYPAAAIELSPCGNFIQVNLDELDLVAVSPATESISDGKLLQEFFYGLGAKTGVAAHYMFCSKIASDPGAGYYTGYNHNLGSGIYVYYGVIIRRGSLAGVPIPDRLRVHEHGRWDLPTNNLDGLWRALTKIQISELPQRAGLPGAAAAPSDEPVDEIVAACERLAREQGLIFVAGEPELVLADLLEKIGASLLYNRRSESVYFTWTKRGINEPRPFSKPYPGALRAAIIDCCATRNRRISTPAIRPFRYSDSVWSVAVDWLISDPENTWDPYLQALESLVAGARWDGEPRVDSYLHDYLGAAAGDPVAQYVSWLLHAGPIKLSLEPGYKLDIVPVLWGPQGLGKSTVLKLLLPGPERLRRSLFNETITWESAKDTKRFIEQVAGKVIVEFSENVGSDRASAERAKQIISASSFRARMSYGRHAKDYLQSFLMVVSTNNRYFIPNDSTGSSRRFAGVECRGPVASLATLNRKIISSYKQRILETFHRLDRGEPVFPDKALERTIVARSVDHIFRDEPLEDILLDIEQGTIKDRFEVNELLTAVNSKASHKRYSWKSIRPILVSRRWIHVPGKRPRCAVTGKRLREKDTWKIPEHND